MGLTRGAKLLIALFILVALIGGAYVAGQSGASIDRFISWLEDIGVSSIENVPSANITFFEGDHRGGHLYELSDGNVEEVKLLNSGELIDYTRTQDHSAEAFIFRPEDILATRVSFKEEGRPSVLLGDFSTIKNGITISPDASLIAYAELTEPMESTLYTPDVTKWNITVIDVTTKKQIALGAGVEPFFLGNSRIVMYSSFDGLVLYSLEAGTRNVLSEFSTTQLDEAAKGSPDGRYIAVFNKTTGTYAIFELYQVQPPRVRALGGLRHRYESLILKENHMLGLSDISGTKRLFSIPYSNVQIREEVLVFPDITKPTRLIP